MKDESDSRKRSIAAAIVARGVVATIYDADRRYPTERTRRVAYLQALITDIAERGDSMLVIEQDDTLTAEDRNLLHRATRDAGCPDLRYERGHVASEIIHPVPDAIAWCWAEGGAAWRRPIEPVVTAVRQV
ncbi:MAG: hypothetical protein ACREQM_16030 [Candidatus Dormibacteraceae bacterium]